MQLTRGRKWLYHETMSWKKRGINAYRNEKGKGAGHDLEFDGEKDYPLVSFPADKLSAKKKQKKKIVPETHKSEVQELKQQQEVTESFIKTATEAEGYRKAAKLILLLGTDQAVKVLKHLEPEEVEAISAEIATIQKIDRIESEHLLKEFGLIMKKPIPRQGARRRP